MGFREWFFEYGGGLGATTSIMHGGMDDPFGKDNTNMPVKSKYVGDGGQKTDEPMTPSPDRKFGFGKFLSRKHSKERGTKRINKVQKRPMRNDVSDIIY
jgi:hypothetical protein